LGEEWALADGYHKIHACCQYSHSTVEAILELIAELGERVKSAKRIVVETHPLGMTLDNRAPRTSLAAKFSIPHIAAATCLFGHAGAEAFASADLDMPALVALRAKVELTPYQNLRPWPNDRPARVRITLDDESQHVRECESARGGPDRPFDAETILGKMRDIVVGPYPAAPALFAKLMRLDEEAIRISWAEFVAAFTMHDPIPETRQSRVSG
jgi:2-methylcitrate dehydratase PrpD